MCLLSYKRARFGEEPFMNSQKEISIRTLETPTEQERYETYYVFRQNDNQRILPYFAVFYPGKGILFVSKILGLIPLTPKDIANTAQLKEQLEPFAKQAFTEHPEEIMRKWIAGLRLTKDTDNESPVNYVFLDKPLTLPIPITDTLVKSADGPLIRQKAYDIAITFDQLFMAMHRQI